MRPIAAELDRLDALVTKEAPRLFMRRLAARAALLRARVAVRDGQDAARSRASLAEAVAACYAVAAGDAACRAIEAEGAALARSR